MVKYRFIADNWKEEDAFYCIAENINIACDIFRGFCKKSNIKVKYVVVSSVYIDD